VLPPKFLHALENHQVLLANLSSGADALLITFFKGESKIGLKCNKGALITSELGNEPDETLILDATLCWGVNASTKFGGTAPLTIWKGKKFSTFYDDLTANISETDEDSDKI